jgi:signal transduction histidine kinase
LAAWAVCYYRVFDVRQVFVSLAQRAGLVLVLGLGVIALWHGLDVLLPNAVALFLGVAVVSSGAFWLDRRSREWLGLGGEQALAELRRGVIEIARTEPNPDKLGAQFESFLRERCHAAFAALVLDRGDAYAAGRLELAKARPGFAVLSEAGWATPETLLRRRATAGGEDLRAFLAEHALGLLVAAPRGSPQPTLLIALGTKVNEWPYTYPEVQRLQNIAELMDNILTRSRLTAEAAMRARIEHLAMMSRGLAHDLNNLITPISSFLVHTDARFPADSPESEVHGAARRSVRIMGDYVREALFFSEQLSLKLEPVDLGRIFQEVSAVTAARAAARGVTVAGTLASAVPFTADAVLLQRLLVNLVGNAIDASDRGQTVTLSATPGRSGWLRLRVVDEGCGIAAENLARVFDPYFTTKKFGSEVRGFGLGLTICQKIVHLHGGLISVASQPGQGATVTVELPVNPSP